MTMPALHLARAGTVVSCMVFAAASSVSADLVHTTFEADSGGPGSWTADSIWNGNLDPGSGATWSSSLANVLIQSDAAFTGQQAGRINGAGTTLTATLTFGSEENTGVFDVSFAMQHSAGPGASGNSTATTYLRDDSNNTIAELRMEYNASTGARLLKVRRAGGDTTLINGYTDGTWYEFAVTLDTEAKLLDIRVREQDSDSWTEATGLTFRTEAAMSFGRITVAYTAPEGAARWDDIRVVPEPASLGLLTLLAPVFLRRPRK